MNNDLLMNDTFDNFNFTQTQDLLTKPKALCNINILTPSQNGYLKTNRNCSRNTPESAPKNEVSFDDSIFLTESLSWSSTLFENSVEKEEKESVSILQDTKNNLNISNASSKSPPNITCVKQLISKESQSFTEKGNIYSKVDNKNNSKSTNGSCKLTVAPENLNVMSSPKVSKANQLTEEKENVNSMVDCAITNENKNLNTKHNLIFKKESVRNSKEFVKNVQEIYNETNDSELNQLMVSEENFDKYDKTTNAKKVSEREEEVQFNPEICKLSSWGLPESVLQKYESRKVVKMFTWQVECLKNIKVLNEYKNLVYSAPTSAGKTLVAEILAIKTIFERHKKVIFILPFISIVREKMYYFQDILGTSGIRVEGFMGSYNPPGGFSSVHLAICTIEKANSLINRLLEEDALSDIGAVLVDEIHLLGDPSRGYLLELLLTKLRYISIKNNMNIQIVGMSATLSNLNHLAKWLDAELYTTDYRPVPLHEQAHVGGEIYDNNLKLMRKLTPLPELGTDTDNILQLCLETIKDSSSVLIFCPTKNWCENLSQQIATAFFKIGSSESEWGELLHSQLKTNLIGELLGQLKYCPVGLDEVLRKTVSFGVAFHHAGLTMDERDIIEGAFRNGVLRVLVATSTLSSGVNLPARRVIIRTPNFHGKPIDVLTYRQMIGRAGRMGRDSVGESFLVCQKNDYKIAKELMSAKLRPIESCLVGAGKLKRAILEIIASGVASTTDDVNTFTNCTLLAVEDEETERLSSPIEEAVNFLRNNEFVRLQKHEDGTEKYVATSLGKACLSSSIAPDEGLSLFTELEKARQCFVLETELHLIYLVTPYSACNSWGNIDWMFYLELWERLPSNMKKVGQLVGVQESYIINATRGNIQTNTNKLHHKLLVHKRFFVALALQDLVNEKPLGEVCQKFNCNRGMLQSLQQSASTFAGMVTAFSRQLGWSSVEILISQFQDRMQFGVSRDLLDLMRLPVLNGKMARILYDADIGGVIQLANSDVAIIENILHKVVPFETVKEREGESEFAKKQRNKFKNVWVTGKEGLTEREAAQILVTDAQRYLKLEMGLAEAKWRAHPDQGDSFEANEIVGTKEENPVEVPRNSKNFLEKYLEESQSNVEQMDTTAKISHHRKKSIENNASGDTSVIPNDTNISNDSSLFSDVSCTRIEDDEFEKCKKEYVQESNNIKKTDSSIYPEENKSTGISSKDNSVSTIPIFKKTEANLQDISHFHTHNSAELNSSTTFSVINFTHIEGNLTENHETKRSSSAKVCNRSFKPLKRVKKVSHLLSPVEVELNISDSSIFSVNSNSNVSVNKTESDQSLFEDSFKLQVSESDKESLKSSPSNELNSESESFLDNAFSGSFNTDSSKELSTDDILTSSLTEEMPNISRKRKNSGDDQPLTTPSKKTKIKESKASKDGSADTLNRTYIRNKSKLAVSDLTESMFDIVDVCENFPLLESFHKELRQQKSFSLSLACSKASERCPVIGNNIIQPVINVEPSQHHDRFCFKNRKLDGFAISWDGDKVFYAPLNKEEYNARVIKIFKTVLANKSVRVKMFSSKEQIKVLHHCCNVQMKGKIDDPKVADWILDPEGREKDLLAMAVKYNSERVQLAQLAGSSKGFGSVALDLYSSVDSKIRAAVEALVTFHLVDSLKVSLKNTNPDYLKIYEVELDTVLCLTRMEINGISVKTDLLQGLVDALKKHIEIIEKKAFSLAGRHFNFVSSRDVAKVIGMFRGRKVSTRKQILEQSEHPISDLVLQWRKINCILTKMIYPLIRVTKGEHIHGCYVTHTSTGRITMHEPNLQNIAKNFFIINPLTNEEMEISPRSVFKVAEEFCLISADYCQLELRIMAHLSQDNLLCSIMRKPGDVFRSIAAKWNNIMEDKVDQTMRQNVKHLCYGIIYGMGAKALANQLSIKEEEAVVFMDTFRNTYPGLKKLIKGTIECCRTKGYVETLFGRRRYLPHINETSLSKKGHAERQAVNTTVQGSAADIAKKAMVDIEHELQEIFDKTKNKPKLVLHLHDELMYEVPEKYVRKVARIVKKNMENSVQLSVPFPVKLKIGKSWGQMTEYTL